VLLTWLLTLILAMVKRIHCTWAELKFLTWSTATGHGEESNADQGAVVFRSVHIHRQIA
jgi:hypothetical protein